MDWLRPKQSSRPADPAAKLQGYWELAKVIEGTEREREGRENEAHLSIGPSTSLASFSLFPFSLSQDAMNRAAARAAAGDAAGAERLYHLAARIAGEGLAIRVETSGLGPAACTPAARRADLAA